jgi:hypothetical protein
VALVLGLGGLCDVPRPPSTAAYFEPATLSVPVDSIFTVDVVVNTLGAVQAWEFSLQTDIEGVLPMNVVPHSDFDDDGRFLVPPSIDLSEGRVNGVVDLKHGGSGVTGTFRIATVTLWAHQPGKVAIGLDGVGMATGEGTALPVNVFSASVLVTP